MAEAPTGKAAEIIAEMDQRKDDATRRAIRGQPFELDVGPDNFQTRKATGPQASASKPSPSPQEVDPTLLEDVQQVVAEVGAGMTPVGVLIDARDTAQAAKAIKNKDPGGIPLGILTAAGWLPFGGDFVKSVGKRALAWKRARAARKALGGKQPEKGGLAKQLSYQQRKELRASAAKRALRKQVDPPDDATREALNKHLLDPDVIEARSHLPPTKGEMKWEWDHGAKKETSLAGGRSLPREPHWKGTDEAGEVTEIWEELASPSRSRVRQHGTPIEGSGQVVYGEW